ncbi:hypothetical protein RhiirC2_785924, partial [Rhizophagus irregularis]
MDPVNITGSDIWPKTWLTIINKGLVFGINEETQDGLIIIYGGTGSHVSDQILVLDTKTNPFNWFIPNINPAPSSAPFRGHTATLVGNYMIIAFGLYRNITTRKNVLNDQIYMIDVSEENNYRWVKSFTPNITKTAYPTKSVIIGGTTGGIAT